MFSFFLISSILVPLLFSSYISVLAGFPPTGQQLPGTAAADPPGIHVIDLKGVSGKRFSGERLRKSTVPLSFGALKRSELKNAEKHTQCKRWIVVTSIFPPSKAVRVLGEMTKKDWCFVVVGDVNGPSDYDDVEGVVYNFFFHCIDEVYLTPAQQTRMHYHIIDRTPWRHFGRKNIGFLYAIEHGAEVIYDTDDDNRLKEFLIPYIKEEDIKKGKTVRAYAGQTTQEWFSRQPGENAGQARKNPLVVNPYRDFNSTCPKLWPRGYPLDNVNDREHPIVESHTLEKPPAVQQFLADEDPDVDAIYRLTHELPCRFSEEDKPLVVPQGSFTPYNAQCVLHTRRAFWGMLLPVTVNGRVSDIWRSYITQRLLWDLDERLAFLPSAVVHDRVFHDYLKDFQSESDLYLKTPALVKFLSQWTSSAPTLVERIEQLWAELYERGFIEIGDLLLAQAWIRDLLALGYKFPDLEIPKILGPTKSSKTEL